MPANALESRTSRSRAETAAVIPQQPDLAGRSISTTGKSGSTRIPRANRRAASATNPVPRLRPVTKLNEAMYPLWHLSRPAVARKAHVYCFRVRQDMSVAASELC